MGHRERAVSGKVASLPEATHFVNLHCPEHGRDRLLAKVDALLRSGL